MSLALPLVLLALFVFRHAAGPSLFYAIFNRSQNEHFRRRKIQPEIPSALRLAEEKRWTRLSALAEPVILLLFWALYARGWTKLYFDFGDHGYGYAVFSFVALFYLQDLYFYLMHRSLHWGPLYRHLHSIHHRSKNPTPWAAFAMHPAEKFLELLIFPALTLVMPFHPLVLCAFVFVSSALNLWGHTGIELNPFRVRTSGITAFHSSSTFHNQHHELNRWNFGLYFSFWDRLFGTEHGNYRATFERNASR